MSGQIQDRRAAFSSLDPIIKRCPGGARRFRNQTVACLDFHLAAKPLDRSKHQRDKLSIGQDKLDRTGCSRVVADGNSGLEVLLVHLGGPFWRNKEEELVIPKGEMSEGEDAASRPGGRQDPYTYGSLPGKEDFFSLEGNRGRDYLRPIRRICQSSQLFHSASFAPVIIGPTSAPNQTKLTCAASPTSAA
jgi:hypothetical protein